MSRTNSKIKPKLPAISRNISMPNLKTYEPKLENRPKTMVISRRTKKRMSISVTSINRLSKPKTQKMIEDGNF